MKNLKIILTGVIIAFALSATGCAEKPIFKLNSMEKEIEYYKGNEVVTLEDENGISSLEFIEQTTDNEFVFFVYVLNKNDKKILFKPDDIQSEVIEESNIYGEFPKSVNAIDPERRINDIEKSMQERETEHAATGINTVFGLFGVTAELMENDPEDAVREAVIWADNQTVENYDYEYEMEDLHMERSFWIDEVLRKTTLGQDEEIGGLVHIPVIVNAEKVKITVPIGNTVYEHYYLQKRIN
ncbi:MAG: hypothetical protein PVH88_00980 [Ignavibacteria bacterium]|jgi:hypothetical protein